MPVKDKIRLKDYKGDLRVVKKISFNNGKIHIREQNETKMDLYILYPNDLLVSKINFHQGALAINKFEKIVCTTHYQPYRINREKVIDEYLVLALRNRFFQNHLEFLRAEGIKNEATYEFIGELEIPLPNIGDQQKIVADYNNRTEVAKNLSLAANDLEKEIELYLFDELGYNIKSNKVAKNKGNWLRIIEYAEIDKWGADQNNSNKLTLTKSFEVKK